MRMVEGQESRVEGRKPAFALRLNSGPRPSTLDTRPARLHRAITLIELLIAMLIISILAGLILGVAARAGESARTARTQHTVLRLHKLLMPFYDTFKTRRVKVRPEIVIGINESNDPDFNSPAEKGIANAFARLYALRELMLMEMPDRWSDILLREVPSSPSGANDALYPYFQDSTSAQSTLGRSGLAAIYLRKYDAVAKRDNSLTGNRNTREEIIANQGAECLYLTITLATGDGEARSHFGEDGIGDTDGDGAFEFLDSWGRPISFLRWAPGFDSQVQINANLLGFPPKDSAAWKSAASGDHDPFDLFRVDAPAFRLVPLIFSMGGDETAGIDSNEEHVVLRGITQGELDDIPEPGNWRAIFPWAAPPSGTPIYLGTAVEEGAADNIHNHLLGRR